MEVTHAEIVEELKKIAPDKLQIAYLMVANRKLSERIKELEEPLNPVD